MYSRSISMNTKIPDTSSAVDAWGQIWLAAPVHVVPRYLYALQYRCIQTLGMEYTRAVLRVGKHPASKQPLWFCAWPIGKPYFFQNIGSNENACSKIPDNLSSHIERVNACHFPISSCSEQLCWSNNWISDRNVNSGGSSFHSPASLQLWLARTHKPS